MNFQKASETDFCTIQKFYWDVIDNIHKNNTENKNLGWEKGVYPSDAFIQNTLQRRGLHVEWKRCFIRLRYLEQQPQYMYYEDTGWTEYKMFELNL